MTHRTSRQRALLSRQSVDEENLIKLLKKKTVSPENPQSDAVSQPTVNSLIQRIQHTSQPLQPQDMLQLQSTLGNHAVAQMMKPSITPSRFKNPVNRSQNERIQEYLTPFKTIARMSKTANSQAPIRTVNSSGTPVQRLPLAPNDPRIISLDKKIKALEATRIAIRVGHGILMLPFTLIDLISNFVRLFKKPKNKSDIRNTKTDKFNNIMMGYSGTVNAMSGVIGTLETGLTEVKWLKWLKYMPWNILLWVSGLIARYIKKVRKERLKLLQG